MNTLKGKRLCLHFDGKQMKQIEDDLDITVTVERIDTSVTSPDFGDSNDILLGVVQAASSKGSARVLRHCRSSIWCVLRHHKFQHWSILWSNVMLPQS
jgi:hypothetical protein